MSNPKTVKGYLSAVKKLAGVRVQDLAGFHNLSYDRMRSLTSVRGDMENALADFEYLGETNSTSSATNKEEQ